VAMRLDHIVLTVRSISATVDFYARALGFRAETVEGRTALHFGEHKINLHEVGREFSPRARLAAAGTGDFCLTTAEPVEVIAERLRAQGIAIEDGPAARTGARSPLWSIYFRDPDENLVEVANERAAATP